MTNSAPHSASEFSRRDQLVVVVILTVLGAGLRLFRLSHWPLEGDELYTLRDSLSGGWLPGTGKPLLFFLNDILIAPWHALDEFGLRLLPFIFGVAAIPILFGLGRRAFGAPTATLSCVLLAFHPWHVWWSQFARYYTLAFLLSMTFALTLFIGSREKKWAWIALGLVSGGLAILAHPSSGVIVAACGIWLGGHHIKEWLQSRSSRGQGVVLVGSAGLIGALVIGAVVIGFLISVLNKWNDLGEAWGHRGLTLILSYGNWVGLGVGLFAVSGLIWMWWEGRKSLSFFMASWWLLPSVVLAFLSYFVSVSVSYLFVTLPAVVILAGWAAAKIGEAIAKPSLRAISLSAIMATLILAPAPVLVSQYLDGGRPDFRAAAQFIESRAMANDIVLQGDPDGALNHYLTNRVAERLGLSPDQLDEKLAAVADQGGQNLWLAATMRERGGFNEVGLSSADTWIKYRCDLEKKIGRPRLDFKRNYVHVYRCLVTDAALVSRTSDGS